MEDLLALLDDHAVSGELRLIEGHINGRHLPIIDSHAALLDQAAGLAVGGAQAAGHQQLDGTDLTIGKPGLRQLGSGHIFAAAAAAEQGAGGLLSLVGLLLAVDQLGQLVGQDLLGLIELAARGRKVSIRMHLSTSASPTFRQYW